MSPTQEREAKDRARAFIDQITAINREHGMGDKVPEDRYQQAVDTSTAAFAALLSRSRS